MSQILKKFAYSLVAVSVHLALLLWPANNRVADILGASNSFNVIAHGNGRALSPGNTLEAAEVALPVGTDILELDIHLTADNILVVRHDETIDSTTNGSGRIAEMTLAELSRFEVGFHKYDYPDKVAERGIRIPTLESLFERFPNNRFLIELKLLGTEAGEALCRLVREYKLFHQALVGSFHSNVLRDFRHKCPEIPIPGGGRGETDGYLLVWPGSSLRPTGLFSTAGAGRHKDSYRTGA